MNKCRICLENKRTLCSIFETDEGISHASMITLVTGIKIVKDKHTLICLLCRRKLKDFYEFKLLIERSDIEISKQSKVFKFNTIDDIKIEFIQDFSCNKSGSDYNTLFTNESDTFYYNNTLIRRINGIDRKSVPIEELLDTIKSEGFEENRYVHDYEQNASTDEEIKFKRKKEVSKLSQKGKNFETIRDVNNIRVQPILLNDIRVLKTSTNIVRKTKATCRFKSDGTLCPFCGKITKSIKTHILTHTGEKKFKCNKCSKLFYTTKFLQYHMKSHSSIKQTFKCEHCISTFSSRGSVIRHMATHLESKDFSCPICKKEFKWKSALRRHMLIHNIAAKSIHCDTCKKSFISPSSLKAHSRVHTGERPYKCELCLQAYSYKRDFNRHCLKKHGVVVDRRSIYVMNEEVLKREKALMKDLMLRLHGIPTETEPMDSFHGPQKALAFAKAVTVMQNGQIPIDVHL